MNIIHQIALQLGEEEVLWQLDKACGKLAQAAHEYRLVRGTKSLAEKTGDAKAALLEEIADVSIFLTALGVDTGKNRMKIQAAVDRKTRCWAESLGIEAEQ